MIVYQKGLDELLENQSIELLSRFNYCQSSLERLPLPINKVFVDSNDFFSSLNEKKLDTNTDFKNTTEGRP